jgi:hypothetical protein
MKERIVNPSGKNSGSTDRRRLIMFSDYLRTDEHPGGICKIELECFMV